MPGSSHAGLLISYGVHTPLSLGSNTFLTNTTTPTMTTTAAIPAGSLAVVAVGAQRSTSFSVSSVSDGTNSYSLGRTSTWSAANGYVVELWYCANASAVGSGATITVTMSAATQNPTSLAACYVRGVAVATPLDKANSTDYSPGTAYSSGTTGALTQANEIAFGFVSGYTSAAQTAVTEGSGFSSIVDQQQGSGAQFFCHLAYQNVFSTTALNYQPTLSVTAYGSSLIATFKRA